MTDVIGCDSGERWDAIVIDAKDNVAVALRDLDGEVRVRIGEIIQTMRVVARIPMGHKVAMHPLAKGEAVLKYGECIGITTAPVATGDHVHVHNLASRRARS